MEAFKQKYNDLKVLRDNNHKYCLVVLHVKGLFYSLIKMKCCHN